MTSRERILKQKLDAKRKEVKKLKKELSALKKQVGMPEAETPHYKSKMAELSARAEYSILTENKNYIGFLINKIRRTRIFELWNKYMSYFRKLGVVPITIKAISYILVLVETSAALFLIATSFIVIIPLVTAIFASMIISAVVSYRTDNKRMSLAIDGKNIFVFFPRGKDELSGRSFWTSSLLDIASHKDSAVIIVSPFFLSISGLGGKHNRFYTNLRRERDNVFLVRRHYFFSLRKHVLTKNSDKLTLVY